MKSKYVRLACMLVLAAGALAIRSVPLLATLAPNKNSDEDTEIFNTRAHTFVGVIGSSEDMLEIDFLNGKISQVGDQFGIGRAR